MYSTCDEIKSDNSKAPSGMYTLQLPSGSYQAYCEMGINGGGYTFLSNQMFATLTQADIDALFKKKDDVLMRILRPDSTQPYTVIEHPEKKPISVLWNSNSGFIPPFNYIKPYLFLSFYSSSQTSLPTVNKFGFISNGQDMLYDHSGNGVDNYFAFFSNPNELSPYEYHLDLQDKLVCERQGLAVDWRKSAKRSFSARGLPLDFFFMTEVHFNLETYTSSDRWLTSASPALGTAIGLR